MANLMHILANITGQAYIFLILSKTRLYYLPMFFVLIKFVKLVLTFVNQNLSAARGFGVLGFWDL